MRPRVPFLVVVSLVAVLMAGCSASPAAPREASPTSTSACAAASSLPSGETTRLSLTVAGADRLFDVHVPAGHDGTTPSPLILGFAGYRAPVGELEREVGLNDSGAVVVYPQPANSAVGTGWQGAPYSSGADDVAFTTAVLDDVESRLCIDTARVFAAGMSNGGGFVSLLSCALPERIAAFAVVSGAVYPATNPPCPDARPVPVIEFHGTADDVIPYDGGTRHDAGVVPVTLWLSQLVARNGCTPEPRSETVSTGVEKQSWTGCRDHGALVHYRIDGGGHVWPGAPGSGEHVDATTLIETFFTAHPLP